MIIHLLQQRIKQDDALVLEEAIKVGIAVTTSTRTIDDVEFGQRELDTGCQFFNLRLQRTIWKRCDFVEKGLNPEGIDGNHDHLYRQQEEPHV